MTTLEVVAIILIFLIVLANFELICVTLYFCFAILVFIMLLPFLGIRMLIKEFRGKT